MPHCLWKFLARISSTFNMTKWDLQLFLGLPTTKQDWPQVLVECLAEIFGTFIIVFFGCGSVLSPAVQDNDIINKNIVDIVQISLAFGLAVFVGVHLAGPVSGGYLNPALALGSMVAGHLSLFRALLFIICQLIGAIVGAGVLYQITPESYVQSHQLGSNGLFTMLNTTCLDEQSNSTCIDEKLSVTPFQGLIIEHIGTLILTMTVLSITDSRSEQYWSPSLMIGLTVALCHLLMIPYTGCSVNPARSFGPALIMNNFKNHWIFWVGPISGALAGALNHRLLGKFAYCKKYEVNSQEKINVTTKEELPMESL